MKGMDDFVTQDQFQQLAGAERTPLGPGGGGPLPAHGADRSDEDLGTRTAKVISDAPQKGGVVMTNPRLYVESAHEAIDALPIVLATDAAK